jgi:hypothetical protein
LSLLSCKEPGDFGKNVSFACLNAMVFGPSEATRASSEDLQGFKGILLKAAAKKQNSADLRFYKSYIA